MSPVQCVATGWAAGNVWAAADIWIAADDAWQRLEAQVPESRRIELKFENLVSAAGDRALERICRFLGVSYEPWMLDIEGDTSYRRPRSVTRVRGATTRRRRRSASGARASARARRLCTQRPAAVAVWPRGPCCFVPDHRWRRMRASQRR